MQKLIARFSDGTTKTRRTDRPYTHAFRVTATWALTEEYLANGGVRFYPDKVAGDIITNTEFGFSASKLGAEIGAGRYVQGYRRKPGVIVVVEVVPVEV